MPAQAEQAERPEAAAATGAVGRGCEHRERAGGGGDGDGDGDGAGQPCGGQHLQRQRMQVPGPRQNPGRVWTRNKESTWENDGRGVLKNEG